MRPPDGLDPRWSRTLAVADSAGTEHRWHVLDNLEVLDGVTPAGTLLCVHGNPTWSYLWRHVIARIDAANAAGGRPWRVVAVDQLGMGFSERTGTRRRLGRRIADLGDLTDALGLSGPVVTLGHDWGGAISLGWALAHREQLAGTALLNTAVHQPPGSALPALIALARLPGVRWAVTAASPFFLQATLALAHPRLRPGVRAGYLAPYRTRARRAAIDDFVEDIPTTDQHPSRPALRALVEGLPALGPVPALLLWGPRDPVFSDLYLRDLRARLPQAVVHRFEGAGHLLAEDADVAGAVLSWLDELPLPPTDRSVTLPSGLPHATTSRPAASAGEPDRRPLWAWMQDRAADPSLAVLEPAAGRRPGSRRISWATLARRTRDLAAGLSASGVAPGDRVGLLVPPGSDLSIALYACLRIGAVAVIADAGLGVAGLHRALRGAGVRHVIAVDRGLLLARALRWPGRRIAVTTPGRSRALVLGTGEAMTGLARSGTGLDLPAEPGPDDEALVVFTSGATGPAKGVVYRHAQLESLRDALLSTYRIRPDDRFVAAFAPFALLGPALGVASAVPDMDVTAPRTLRATALADAVAGLRASVVFASPAALANVVATAAQLGPAQREALSRIRLVLSAGAPVPATLLGSVQELTPSAELHTPYGMTEALLVTDVDLGEVRDAGPGEGILVGRPIAGVDVALAPLDEFGRSDRHLVLDKAGVTGEILVRAAHVKQRYDQLWITDRDARSPEGWHRTGDVGHLDDAGRLWVEGRLVHVLTPLGGFVTPVGVEQKIETLEDVARAALVAVGPVGAQQLVAVLETRGRATPGVADPDLSARVRAVAGVDLAAVLLSSGLKTDIRHNAKVDRRHEGRRAARMLAGHGGTGR